MACGLWTSGADIEKLLRDAHLLLSTEDTDKFRSLCESLSSRMKDMTGENALSKEAQLEMTSVPQPSALHLMVVESYVQFVEFFTPHPNDYRYG
jgi:hypothetical protein